MDIDVAGTWAPIRPLFGKSLHLLGRGKGFLHVASVIRIPEKWTTENVNRVCQKDLLLSAA